MKRRECERCGDIYFLFPVRGRPSKRCIPCRKSLDHKPLTEADRTINGLNTLIKSQTPEVPEGFVLIEKHEYDWMAKSILALESKVINMSPPRTLTKKRAAKIVHPDLYEAGSVKHSISEEISRWILSLLP